MLSPATLKVLREELENPALDEYTVVVLARRDLERGDDTGAISRLRVDCDKFAVVAPLLCKLLSNREDEREATNALWTRPPQGPSPTERNWVV